MTKRYKFRELLKERLKGPAFRREWEETQGEFDLACQVIEMRIGAGLTQRQLAERANTSQPAIARLESGTYRNVSMAFLRRVGKALGAQPHVTFRKSR